MTSLPLPATTIPSFYALKPAPSASNATTARFISSRAAHNLAAKASLKDVAVAVAATAASVTLASQALAIQITLGSDDGGLVFVPQNFEVAAGEKIVFYNNAGFPHNVIFDEDEVPAGVNASKISMSEEDLLNAKGDTFEVSLTEKGTYAFYCAPHQGAGMVGKVTVK